jgi:hypothetical protein
MKDRFQKFLLGVLCLTALPAMAAQRIHVMILDGESAAPYHKWKSWMRLGSSMLMW